ncbi:RDD family protein [Haloarcula montana]|uniref:RDD family protein n=1 Tax=Haloarcula montana TaxID=3111776 RepID=UPI002D77ED9B|nr:RDD family protein [Haloarcula sp. GH36]
MEADSRTLHIASWTDRFLAWLVDVILVGAVLGSLGELASVFSVLTGNLAASPLAGLNGVALFLYWTALEGSRGQSAGKMVMSIAVTDERGESIDYSAAAIESFGKAFILPLDCLIGWLAYDKEGLRLFNRLSSTIVIEQDGTNPPEDVEYVYPGDE